MDFRSVIPSAIKTPFYIETKGFLRTFIGAVFEYFLVFEDEPTREKITAAVDHVNEVLLRMSGYGIENLKPPDLMDEDEVEGETSEDENEVEGQNSDSDDWSYEEEEEEKIPIVETSKLVDAIVLNRPRYGAPGEKLEKIEIDLSNYKPSDWDATMEGLTHKDGLFGNAILAQALQDLFIRSLADNNWPIINPHFDFSEKLKRILDLSQPAVMESFLEITTNPAFVAGMKTFLQQPVAAEGLSFAGDVFLVWGLPGRTAYTLKEDVPSVTVAEKIRTFLNPPPVMHKKRKLSKTPDSSKVSI
jgi:hypothetical protein